MLEERTVDSPLLIKPEPPEFIPEYLFCADLSLRQPGFALLFVEDNGRIRIVDTSVCRNKSIKGTHGELLGRIATHMRNIVKAIPEGSKVTFVRERAFTRFPNETQILLKVVGVTDYLISREFMSYKLDIRPREWMEIAPKSIKAVVAGSGNATKDDVKAALHNFVGVHEYETFDESDAVAVGVAYAIQNDFARQFKVNRVGKVNRMPLPPKKKGTRKVPKQTK